MKNRSNKPFDVNHPDYIEIIKLKRPGSLNSTWVAKILDFVLLVHLWPLITHGNYPYQVAYTIILLKYHKAIGFYFHLSEGNRDQRN